jgi:hypothetical protein
MSRRSRFAPRLEVLEDRTVPSLTLSYLSGGSLTISGIPRGELDVKHVGTVASMFRITDAGSFLGQYSITGNLSISLSYRTADIKIDLGGGTISGTTTINLGNGFIGSGTSSVDVYDDSGASPAGKIGGGLTIQNGNGHELLDVGTFRDPVGGGFTTDPIRVGSNLSVTGRTANNGPGNSLIVDAGTIVGGSANLTQVHNLALGGTSTLSNLTSIGGGLTLNDSGALVHLSAVVTASIGGSVNVTGTTVDDSFTLQSNGTTNSGRVRGSLTVNLLDGQSFGDRILLASGTEVDGNAQLTAGANTSTALGDQLSPLGSVMQSLTVTMGNNTNSLYFSPQNVGDQVPFVGGDMTVTAGNGTNYIGTSVTGPFNGTIVGSTLGGLSITLGTGDNGSALDPMVIAPNLINGNIVWKSGFDQSTSSFGLGQAFVQLGNFGLTGNSYSYNVSMTFGNDDDSLVVDIGLGTITTNDPAPLGPTWFIDGQGATTQNTFHLASGNEGVPFNLVNWTIV